MLAMAFVLAVLGVKAASQADDARSDASGGEHRDLAAAHADVDPLDHGIPGWYTLDQADRGREAYAEHCAECHSPDLRARSAYISLYAYPALTGAYFWDRWSGQTVHALLLVTQESMPLHAPGTLEGDTYADIVAHVLRVNGFPSGDAELPSAQEVERLVAMPIEPDFARPAARAQRVGDREEAPEEEVDPQQDMEDDPDEPDEPDDPEEPEEPVAEAVPARDDGWFTERQVERARDAYFVHCSRCHGSVMQGVGVAPALSGANFQERWDGESLADLFWVVSELMPLDDQGALDPWTSADLVAYILSQNDYPSGPHQLPPSEEQLEGYVIGAEPEEP
jgi:S-disulfanyl-L-cysteine oxidoreductase SoxD